jgi:hypothetical protein
MGHGRHCRERDKKDLMLGWVHVPTPNGEGASCLRALNQMAKRKQKSKGFLSSCYSPRDLSSPQIPVLPECRNFRLPSRSMGSRMLNPSLKTWWILKAARAHVAQCPPLHYQQRQALSSRQDLHFLREKLILKPARAIVRLPLSHIISSSTASGLPLRRRQSLHGKRGGGRKGYGSKRRAGTNDCVGYVDYVQEGSAVSLLTITLPQMAQQTLRGTS